MVLWAAGASPSDEAGGRQVAAGLRDDVDFTVLFRAHHRRCLALARRLVKDEDLAHDVVQEVFLAWWRSAGGAYRAERGELSAWLLTLTHHKAVDAVRMSERHRRGQAVVLTALQCRPAGRPVDEEVWWELGKQDLIAALPVLSAAQREVLGLAYFAGLTQSEIAVRVGIPLGTVKTRTRAGLLRLRAVLDLTWAPDVPTECSSLTPEADWTAAARD